MFSVIFLTSALFAQDIFTMNFSSADEAAKAFVNYTKSLSKSQRIEYCVWIYASGENFRLGSLIEGDSNQCPRGQIEQSSIVASVHTHPRMFGGLNLTAPAQLFSDADMGFANYPGTGEYAYLGAPAGHVLKYKRGSSVCRGSSWVQHPYQIIQGPDRGASGSLPFKADEWRQQDVGGKRYCRKQ
jgi:hypothetical protein